MHMSKRHTHPKWRGLASAIPLVLFLLGPVEATQQVTTKNLGDYPWLQQGSTATYTNIDMTGASFILPNGTVLINIDQAKEWANANLTWLITNRIDDVVSLNVTYKIMGIESGPRICPPCQPKPIKFAYHNSIIVNVDLHNNSATVDGKPEGTVPFWAAPLPAKGVPVVYGTVFVAGQAYDVSSPPLSAGSPPSPFVRPGGGYPIVNGRGYADSYIYLLAQQEFVFPNADVRIAWLNYSVNACDYNGTNHCVRKIDHTPLFPFGQYDYYTGLALQFTLPAYPWQYEVCRYVDNNLTDCGYVTYGTTLGEYFHSGAAPLYLLSTNVPIGPSSSEIVTTSSSGSVQPTSSGGISAANGENPYGAYYGPVLIVASMGAVTLYLVARRKRG